jgi:preprotein translocase subunit SecD
VRRRDLGWLAFILLITAVALSVNLAPRANPQDANDRRELWLGRDVHTRLGLDLRGGTQVLLRSRDPNITTEELDQARGTIERRVNGLGVSEPTVQSSGTDRIIVELPEVSEPEEALELIRSTGRLEFIDSQGQTLPTGLLVRTELSPEPSLRQTDGVTDTAALTDTATLTATEELSAALAGPLYPVVADGKELVLNSVQPSQGELGQPAVSFEFGGDSAQQLQAFTAQNVGRPLSIVLDNRVVSSANIQSPLPGSGQITTSSAQERDALLNLLRYGSLPKAFDVETSRIVSPTLGLESVNASLIAGAIGLVAVALFMIMYYRLPGLLAVLALLIYTAISFALYRLIPVTLTLAGIAGFILSIGLAVDGNVLIFARLKEELRRGRSLVTAVEEGFRHAWPSIRDSNAATLITTMILYWFGSSFGVSIIRGFAITLGLGVVISLFTSVVVTRTFLRLVVRSSLFRKHWWYAVEEPTQPSGTAQARVA